jgi:putative endonuclease
MTGFVYMTASKKGGTIYIGVTNDLNRRLPERKEAKGRASRHATASTGWSGMRSISISARRSSARNR